MYQKIKNQNTVKCLWMKSPKRKSMGVHYTVYTDE